MQLTVFFTPAEIVQKVAQPNDIYIVIDVIRATTTMAVMLERGAVRVLAAENTSQARAAHEKFPHRLLCGERNVKPIPGFDYGNSPSQFATLDLSGREMILTTTNGTRAFHACPSQTIRLAGSLYNAKAVITYALQLARQHHSNIAFVCSGELGYFALDDAVCAGFLALELQRQFLSQVAHTDRMDALASTLDLHESVLAAIALHQTYDLPAVLNHCNSARSVFEAGLEEDPYFCIQTSKSNSVPIVVGQEEETGLLILERATGTDGQSQ